MALIKTVEEIRAHVAIDKSFQTLDPFTPHINLTERYVKKILGAAQYLALKGAYEMDTTTAEQDALLAMIHPALARLTVFSWASQGGLSISNNGMRRTETTQEKTAFKYQEDALKQKLVNDGFTMLDDVVAFLDENEGDYPLWVNDAVAYTKYKQFIINTAEEFQACYDINESRITFKAFFPLLKHVEHFSVADVLKGGLYTEIKSQIKTKTVSADNQYLLDEYLKDAVANLVVAMAMDAYSVDIDGGRIRVIEMQQSFPGDVAKRDAPREKKDELKAHCTRTGQGYLAKLKAYLDATASEVKYPGYYAAVVAETSSNRNEDTTKATYRA